MLVPISLIKALNLTKCFRLTARCNITSRSSKFSALQDKTINNERASRFTTGLSRWNWEVWCACVYVGVWLLHHWCPLNRCSTYDPGQSASLLALISPLPAHTDKHTLTHSRTFRQSPLAPQGCSDSIDRVTELSSSTVPFLSPLFRNRQNWPEGDTAAQQSSDIHTENTGVPFWMVIYHM